MQYSYCTDKLFDISKYTGAQNMFRVECIVFKEINL